MNMPFSRNNFEEIISLLSILKLIHYCKIIHTIVFDISTKVCILNWEKKFRLLGAHDNFVLQKRINHVNLMVRGMTRMINLGNYYHYD